MSVASRNTDPVADWVRRAEQDYAAAEQLDAKALGAIVCFHCHQCAEKYLKALITMNGGAPEPTHDLIALIEQLPGGADLSEEAVAAVGVLDGFAVVMRWAEKDPEEEEVAEALRAVRIVRTAARRLLALE